MLLGRLFPKWFGVFLIVIFGGGFWGWFVLVVVVGLDFKKTKQNRLEVNYPEIT